jgi:chemotaxis protein methyltransferase CheR
LAYLDPEDPIAHLHLGLALEGAGEQAGARRAFGTARRALQERGTGAVEAVLEGYAVGELLQLLDAKVGGAS